MRLPSVAVALLLSALNGACSRSPSDDRFPRANVVLISIDTLRADRVGAYGSKSGLTPALDGVAAAGVVFEEAYSQVPLTLPSHASLFTALLPPRHGVRDNLGYTLKGKATIAESFRKNGYRSIGAVSSFVLRSGTGVSAGFDRYDDAIATRTDAALGQQQRDGSSAARSLTDEIGRTTGPFFAFLHLYEPHTPYTPPDRHKNHGSAYDGEVAWADEIVSSFLASLKAMKRFDNTIVAIVADHGEGLGDHGEKEHGVFLYREAMHVPLILRLPQGAHAGKRIGSTVRLMDVGQTLLDLAGLTELPQADGSSLRPLLAEARPDRPAYSESFYGRLHMGWSEIFAVTEGRHRYIRAPKAEFYDIVADTSETKNLIADKGALAKTMDGWLTQAGASSDVASPNAVDAETRERLQALGYLGASSSAARRSTGSRPDPKDHIASWSRFEEGLALRTEGHLSEALRVFEAVLRENPEMADGWETYAQTLFRAGRTTEARRAFDRVVSFDPSRSSAHISLAKIERFAGRIDESRRHAEIAARQDPGGALEFLAELELGLGRIEQAETAALSSIASDPSRPMSHYALGVAAMRRNDPSAAEPHFREAVLRSASSSDHAFVNLHASLADCLARLGREAEAEAEFLKEIEAMPASRPGRVGLAMLLRSQGRDDESRRTLTALAERPTSNADDFDTVVRTLQGLGDPAAAAEWRNRARARFPQDPRFR